MDDVIILISETQTRDQNGVWITGTLERSVLARVDSVTANEFFEGGRNGLNPEVRFRMFCPDYNGERVIGWKGQKYAVYRTYRKNSDVIELYAERKGGTNGGY